MKLDSDLQLKILETVGIYANRFGIQEPKALLTTREVLELPKKMTEGRRTSAYKYYGASYIQHNMIFVNVRKMSDEKTLENTIVHELIHLRFPYLSHGKRFRKLVRQALAGKRFLPYKRRMR